MAEKNYPEDIKKAALPAMWSNSIFGLGIFEYPVGRPHRKFSYFYIATILFIYTSAAFHSFPYLIDVGHRILSNQIIITIFYGSQVFLTVSSLLVGWYRNEGIHLLIQRALASDGVLKKIGIDPNYREVYKSQLLGTAIYVLIIGISMSIINVSFLYKQAVSTEAISFLVVLNFPTIAITIGDATFLNVVQYVRTKLKKLNDLLKNKLISSSNCSQHKNVLKQYRTFVNFQKKLTTNSFATHVPDDMLFTLRMARIGHLNFTKLCEAANEVFAFHISISLIVAIVTLTGCLYHSYALLRSGKLKMIHYDIFAIMGSMSIFSCIRIYMFAKCCNEVTEESINTGDIISEMYDENINDESKAEIRQFETQLIERPLRIQNNGSPLDYTFIQQSVSIVATFLIILTQCGNVSIEIPG